MATAARAFDPLRHWSEVFIIVLSVRAACAAAIFIACLLAPLTNLKAADVQPVEVFLLAWNLSVAIWIAHNGGKFSMHPRLARLGRHYAAFSLMVFVLSVLALRLDFRPPGDAVGHLLRTPELLFIARLTQFGLAATSMIVLANVLSQDSGLIRFLAASYMWVGVANAAYATVSWCVLAFAGVDLSGAYWPDLVSEGLPRARAFFNEGGPYGLYAVSVVLVVMFRRYALRDIGRGVTAVAIAVVGTSIVLSISKAAFVCLVAIWFWLGVRKIHMRQIILTGCFATVVIVATPIRQQLEDYYQSYSNLEIVAALQPDNGNLVVGRIAALYIVPRIVADHPLVGVGFGNYSLVRNNAKYLGMIPESRYWDLPGLGLAGYAAELGIPLLVYLLWIIWSPVRIGLRTRASGAVVALGAFQFFAQMCGAQITFFYPWLVAALALGLLLQVPGEGARAREPRLQS